MIKFDKVSIGFGDGSRAAQALDGLSLEIPRGEMCAVMGPSGSGKSTMVHAAAGLIRPDSGEVTLDGETIDGLAPSERSLLRRRRIGVVFQFFNLLPLLSAYENVALPLRLDGVARNDEVRLANAALARVGMRDHADNRAFELSGGEMQRVAIARALVISPDVILADEPTGNLDSANGRQVMEVLGEINTDTEVTTLVVTHDPLWASVCHRIVRLVDGRVSEDIDLREGESSGAIEAGLLDAS